MTENDNIQELEEMRLQLGELKSMLKEQTIVNERMMRKAMKGKYNKVRNEIKFSIVLAFLAMPFMAWLLPTFGLPMWFTAITLAFVLSAGIASVFSLRHYVSENLMTGNLTSVALRIIRYKRFGVYWFFYAIPFLIFWLVAFFYYITRGHESEYIHGVIVGGIVGGVIGATLGTISYIRTLCHLNSILKQIKELKGGKI